jgi:hypothetical protein
MTKALTTALLISAAIVLAGSAARAETAMEQLQRATGGQTTGQTFDGGKTLTDAVPKGGVTVQTPASKSIDTSSGTATSTGTAGGFDVNTSTGSAKTTRKGTETAK